MQWTHRSLKPKISLLETDGHGNVDLVKSLRESCDVYYELAQKVGLRKLPR